MTWQLILAGLLIGALVGLAGMGGGSLMTPILVIIFGSSRPSRSGPTSSPAHLSQDAPGSRDHDSMTLRPDA